MPPLTVAISTLRRHTVLARTPDAPEGIKGISLFLVPKLKVKNCTHLRINHVHRDPHFHKFHKFDKSDTCHLSFDLDGCSP